jgi:hypothetical protein
MATQFQSVGPDITYLRSGSRRWGSATHCSLPLGLGGSATHKTSVCVHWVQQQVGCLDASLYKYLLPISYSCYFISCNNTNFWNISFLGYLDALRVAEDHGAARKPRTQLHVPWRQDIVDDAVSTYLLLHSGVSPPFKGDTTVRARATHMSSMPVHFSWVA